MEGFASDVQENGNFFPKKEKKTEFP